MEIWTEDEEEIRSLDNLMNPHGKKCKNCQWGNTESGEQFVTCGYHHENFSANSFCGYWTSLTDPKVKAYFDRRKKELKAKLRNGE